MLGETVFPQLKKFIFWNALQDGKSYVPECKQCLKICGLVKAVFSSGNSQKSHAATSHKNSRWSNFIIPFFGQNLIDFECIMFSGSVMTQDPSVNPKFRSSSMNKLT
jgi:hypothetical protein